ncbi:MAG: sulfotransferase family 2 domain-containing protein, partial [Pseudomonadota bacterium]|nr:sulfotransferase family 2 domain-containing protein [Pseudomonadota bacterium]
EIGIDKWNSKLKFAIVRNPWDKVVSHYHYRVKTNQTQLRDKPIPFKEWVKLTYGEQVPFYFNHPEMFIPQLDWITDKEGNIIVDEVIRFENLEQEFHDVMKKLSLNLYLPHVNSTKRGSYRDYYDEETAEIVRSWFMRDIEYFKYTY